jgi:hypothetical protein
MKKVLFISILWLATLGAAAQIPYFAATVGDGKLYSYTSVKARPGINRQETYTTFQYGLSDHFATGIDLYTGSNSAYWGVLMRYGTSFSQWFNIGAEVTPSFNLNDNYRFSYLTSALYLNGSILSDGSLFWCSNTWWVVNRDAPYTFSNYEYLGYTIPLGERLSLTPMAGVLHSWLFDQDADMAAGCYLTIKHWNIYLWGNDLLKSHPRIVLGVDCTL